MSMVDVVEYGLLASSIVLSVVVIVWSVKRIRERKH